MSLCIRLPIVRRSVLVAMVLTAYCAYPSASPAQDPVRDLKRELLDRVYVDQFLPPEQRLEAQKKAYTEREARIGKLIDGRLTTFTELRQALMLKEWGDMSRPVALDADNFALASDARLRSRIAQRYRDKVHAVVERGDDVSKAAIANVITELGLTVRAVVDPEKFLKLDRLMHLEKPTAAEETERTRLIIEIDAERRAGFARSLTDELVKLASADNEWVMLHALRALGGSNPDPKRAAKVFGAHLASDKSVQARRIAADGLLRLVIIANYLKENELKLLPVLATKDDLLIAGAEVVRYAPTGLQDPDPGVRAGCAEAIRATAQIVAVMLKRVPEKDLAKKDAPAQDFTPSQVAHLKELLKAFHDAGPRLAGALQDADGEVRLQAAQAVERMSETRYRLYEEPLNVLTFGKVTPIRLLPKEASDPLANFAKGDWHAVARLLTDGDKGIRLAAANFLEYFPEARPAVVPDLIKALSDADALVRQSAARGLGNFSKNYAPPDGQPAAAALGKLLFDSDYGVRITAAATLEGLGMYAEPAVPDLARAVNFGDVEHRVATLYVLQSVGPQRSKSAISAVTEAVDHPDARVRRAAAETLAKYGALARNQATIEALRRALGDDDQEVRINASEALLSILDPAIPTKR